jgi:preprotein translocase SecE subunit
MTNSFIKDNGLKIKQAFFAIFALAVAVGFYRILSFCIDTYQLGATIPYAKYIAQLLSVIAFAMVYMLTYKHKELTLYISEVIEELPKIIYPSTDTTTKQTIIVMIGVAIMGIFLGIVDWITTWILF